MKVKFTTNIDEKVLKAIKVRAVEESRNVNEIMEELLKNYLNKKEKENMKKELNVLRHKEDGSLTIAYSGIDLNDYNYITIEEFIEEVEGAEAWSNFRSDVYEKAFEDVGLDYNSYDDPDIMWTDFLDKVNN